MYVRERSLTDLTYPFSCLSLVHARGQAPEAAASSQLDKQCRRGWICLTTVLTSSCGVGQTRPLHTRECGDECARSWRVIPLSDSDTSLVAPRKEAR